MRPAVLSALFLAAALEACVVYEYEHEFWLRVDGSGSVYVTGRPELWSIFKNADDAACDEGCKTHLRALFGRSGLHVRRVTQTRRSGRVFLFIAADFDDVNRLGGSPAFPDLEIRLIPERERFRLTGVWRRPTGKSHDAVESNNGMVAIRFHLPSKVYEHKNAFAGVQRGNIVGWRESLSEALDGRPLEFGVVMDQRSILSTTIMLFLGSILTAFLILTAIFFVVIRRGRRRLHAAEAEEQPRLMRSTAKRSENP
jgi:hypothetical protein